MTKQCRRCRAPFEPNSNRQVYCGKDCKAKANVDQKRCWRRVVAAYRKHNPDLGALLAEHWDRPSGAWWLKTNDTVDLAELLTDDGRRATVPDKSDDWADGKDVTYCRSRSGVFVYQLDANDLKAQDRMNHGLPVAYEVTETVTVRRIVLPPQCSHYLNGLWRPEACEYCKVLAAHIAQMDVTRDYRKYGRRVFTWDVGITTDTEDEAA